MNRIIAILLALSIVVPASAFAQSTRGQIFILADTDQSAALSFKEFKQFINLLAKSGHRNAKRVKTFRLYSIAWSRVDSDGDGYATRAELSSTQMAFGASQRQSKSKVTSQ